MALVTKNDVTQIFAIQAPSIDLPPTFANYPRGWDTARSNNGKPTIKQFNYIQQRTDQNILWIHQNGAGLPYDATMEYADEAIVRKDGELQQLKGGQWKPIKDSDVIKTVESIADLLVIQNPKDGQIVYVKNNAEGYSSFYSYKPIEGGWIVKESKADATANIFTKRCNGFISLFEFIPEQYHLLMRDYTNSKEQVGDVSDYIQEALNYAHTNRLDVLAPFAFYFTNKQIDVPPRIRFVGLSQPYILGLDTFVDEALLSTDRAEQFEFYIDNFYLNGIGEKDLVGLHVGGCRNSTFKQLQITACFKASVWVHPTHPESGDVENIELDHIWSVRGAGLLFETNSSISRGNITDGTITNCQLTSGDTNVKDGFPLALIASTDRYIFGLKFDRVFTKTTDETHILINPNGGMIYGNEFSFFTGESWAMGSGAPSLSFNQSTMYVLDGAFQKNKFTNFYMTGLQGNGISLGNGSVDNDFDGLICNDFNPVQDNQWIEFRSGADRNSCTNVNIDYGLRIEQGATSANNIFGKKIKNFGQFNTVKGGKITQTPPTLIKRDKIFANNGVQLTNYPVVGCGFNTVNGNLSVTVPSGNTPYYLEIPFINTANYKGDRVGVLLNYQFNGATNGLSLAVHLCDAGKQITDYTAGKDNVMAFIAPLVADRKKLVVSFLGNRTVDTTFIIKDIVIVEGDSIPYFYNYHKNYIES